jgi:hypothetical protein
MQAILQFAENRGKDAEILTNRLNNVFEPVANMLTPASAPRDDLPFSMGAPAIVPPPADVPAAAGLAATNPALIRSESGGNWRAQNDAVGSGGNIGHFGRGQFGVARLNDAKRAGVIPADMTPQQFMADPAAQVATEQWHENDIMSFAAQNGITDRIGDTINGVPITREGIVNVAHLGGNAGARRFFETNGQYNPADANGTRLSDYLAMGADGGVDQTYRNLGNALNVSISTSGSLDPSDRRNVESMLGAILNEVYDPESAIADEKRNKVADVLAGLGVGFGQMSRGDRVDLSEVRNAAERRRNQNIQLRMERAKRAAGASYAMELGDEGLARAIAGGAADVSTLLTKRQQDMVEARALRSEAQQFATNDALISALEEGGMTISDAKRTAIMNGGPAVLDTLFTQQERTRALESLEAKLEIDEDVQTTYMAIADLVSEQAEQSGDPRQMMIAQIMRAARGTKSYAEAEAEAGSLFATQGNPGEVAAAQTVLANPNATATQREAAQIVVATNGATTMPDAVASLIAGEASAPSTETERAFSAAQETAAQEGRLSEFTARYPNGVMDFMRELRQVEGTGLPPGPAQATIDMATLPPVGDSIPGSLLAEADLLGGVQGAAQRGIRATAGQLFSDFTQPEFSRVETAYNSWRNDAIQSLRAGGRLLAQELQLIERDVAPQPGVTVAPEVFVRQLQTVDGELRRKMAALEATGQLLIDEGFRDSTDFRENLIARSQLAAVLQGLHEPKEVFAVNPSAENAVSDGVPETVRNNASAFADLSAAAEKAGLTPEDVWQALSEDDRQLFFGSE